MIILLSLLFLTSLLVVAIVFSFISINNSNNKNGADYGRVRRLHEHADVLLETLGMKPDGQLPDDVAKLASDGHKIEAIKRYRELTGVGLKEAKDAIEGQEDLTSLERKLDRVLRELALNEGDHAVKETSRAVKDAPTMLTEIERLVTLGHLIPAVKQYKTMTGSSLLEAKEAVEQIQLRQQSR